MNELFEKVFKNLERNNMKPYYAKDRVEALEIVKSLLRDGDTVAVGGSVTLDECGVIDYIRSANLNFLDRYKEGLTREEINDIHRAAFSADAYLCSSNAITENGELYNVDGNANRVAAICFGPKSVIMVVGKNKIVKDVAEAVKRVKTIAAPKNSARLNCQTYCNPKGECMGLNGDFCDGCESAQRICCDYVLSAYQRLKDRIKIVLVDEILGF